MNPARFVPITGAWCSGWSLESPCSNCWPTPFWSSTPGSASIWGNPACTRSIGHTLADWKGRSVLDLLHPDDLEVVLVRLSTLEGKPVGVRVKTADDQWRHWELLANAITDGDVRRRVGDLRS